VRGLPDADAVLGTLARPVLALWMDADWLVPRAAVERLRALTPRADWRIDTLDGAALGLPAADHFGWLKRPDAVSRRIADWVSRRPHG
jgi:pimeloyl-ACP methyl ester carboxylesterase